MFGAAQTCDDRRGAPPRSDRCPQRLDKQPGVHAMRNTHSDHGLTVLAVAGNHVVLLGWDLAADAIRAGGILGFAIRRTRHEDGDRRWLSGLKTFAATLPNPAPGVPVSSYRHPFQTFQWADYSAEPGKTYTYRVVPVAG